jgi:hypothetical protein
VRPDVLRPDGGLHQAEGEEHHRRFLTQVGILLVGRTREKAPKSRRRRNRPLPHAGAERLLCSGGTGRTLRVHPLPGCPLKHRSDPASGLPEHGSPDSRARVEASRRACGGLRLLQSRTAGSRSSRARRLRRATFSGRSPIGRISSSTLLDGSGARKWDS